MSSAVRFGSSVTYVPDFDTGVDSLVRFHVEALDPVDPVDFRQELWVELDVHGHPDEHPLGVQCANAPRGALVEADLDARQCPTATRRLALLFIEMILQLSGRYQNSNNVYVYSNRTPPSNRPHVRCFEKIEPSL